MFPMTLVIAFIGCGLWLGATTTLMIRFGFTKSRAVLIWLAMMLFPALILVLTFTGRYPTAMALVRIGMGPIIIACLGLILFFVKFTRLFTYATAELIAAIGLAAKTMYELTDVVQPIQLLTLFAAAYLVVRGLENLHNSSPTFSRWVEEMLRPRPARRIPS